MTMTPTEVAALLDVSESTLNEFETRDPANNGNRFKGYLCRQSDHRYGALVIVQVNNEDTDPQVIYCTPKLHYPFERSSKGEAAEDRKYRFPTKIVRGTVYEKLDGTNVFAYSYANAAGERFITFKTRLTPILNDDSKWGSFYSLWSELMEANVELREMVEHVREGVVGLSFELYGYRNQHLIVYEEALATKLLFVVQQNNARVLPPEAWTPARGNLFALVPEANLQDPSDLIHFYNEKRDEADAQNVKLQDGDEEVIKGTEGYIFYLLDETGEWSMWKCKPDSVEVLHWTTDYLPEAVILPTVWNSLESCPGELTVEYVRELLLEEFSDSQVNKSDYRIRKCVDQVKATLAWREKVMIEYRSTGLSWEKDGKGAVMRALSGRLPREKMRAAFSALKQMGIAN